MSTRLRDLRAQRGWTAAQAADAMGISRSHYVKLERGDRGLSLHTIELAAKAFGIDKASLLEGWERDARAGGQVARFIEGGTPIRQDDEFDFSARSQPRTFQPQAVPVIGMVEAGSFREIDYFGEPFEPEVVFDEPDPDFPRAKRIAVEVQGDSMNAADPPLLPGYRIVCVDFEDAGVPLSDGMTVIVQRTRDGGLIREWSVKEVEMGEDEVRFCPRSTNPVHKPIVVPIESGVDDAVEVKVLAIARSVSVRIPRFRTKRTR